LNDLFIEKYGIMKLTVLNYFHEYIKTAHFTNEQMFGMVFKRLIKGD